MRTPGSTIQLSVSKITKHWILSPTSVVVFSPQLLKPWSLHTFQQSLVPKLHNTARRRAVTRQSPSHLLALFWTKKHTQLEINTTTALLLQAIPQWFFDYSHVNYIHKLGRNPPLELLNLDLWCACDFQHCVVKFSCFQFKTLDKSSFNYCALSALDTQCLCHRIPAGQSTHR